MGDITLGNVAAKSVQIETSAGDVELSEITADTFRLVSDMGDVDGTALKYESGGYPDERRGSRTSGTFFRNDKYQLRHGGLYVLDTTLERDLHH